MPKVQMVQIKQGFYKTPHARRKFYNYNILYINIIRLYKKRCSICIICLPNNTEQFRHENNCLESPIQVPWLTTTNTILLKQDTHKPQIIKVVYL